GKVSTAKTASSLPNASRGSSATTTRTGRVSASPARAAAPVLTAAALRANAYRITPRALSTRRRTPHRPRSKTLAPMQETTRHGTPMRNEGTSRRVAVAVSSPLVIDPVTVHQLHGRVREVHRDLLRAHINVPDRDAELRE